MSRTPPHIESDAASGSDVLIGRTIGEKFALERLLGAGAMGAVYLARQITLDKRVAIKVMHRWLLADPTFATRFHREAKAASRLDHPNSIRILDFGEEPDGLLYIAMDYLDGRDLLHVIQEDWPLPPWRIVDIVAQTLSALAMAHDMGVLHRDLKPENIMVLRSVADEGGSVDLVKVCDFGIAKIIESRDPVSSMTAKQQSTGGVLVGTPAYMSPEQAQGEPIDARSDLYSVGVLLYQILTMCLPFEAASAVGLLLKHVHEKPPLPSTVSSAVHPGLEAVCLKAMSKKPSDRYQNARQMRSALRTAIGNEGRPTRWEGEDALSPSPSLVHVKADPPSSGRGSDTATLPSITPVSPRPGGPFVKVQRSARSARPWMLAAGLILGTLVFFVVRSRTKKPIEADGPSVLSASTPTVTAVETKPEVRTAPNPIPPEPPVLRGSAGAHTTPAAKHKGHAAKPAPEEPPAPGSAGVIPAPTTSSPVAPSADPAAPAASPPAEPVSPPPPPPVQPPEPTPVALPPPLPPPPPPRPSFDLATAKVEIGAATSTSGTTPSNVNKVIAPLGTKLTACYRNSLRQGSEALEGVSVLHVATNEDGIIMDARLDGLFGAGAGPCITATVRGRKIANVDTGNASADIPLTFKPR